MKVIDNFSGDYFFLSNFYPCRVKWQTIVFPSAEHAYQASKTMDYQLRVECAKLNNASASKRWGKKITLRDDWEFVKTAVMLDVVRRKFRDVVLKDMLLATESAALIEGNTWGDDFWGCTMVGSHWRGENYLGRILMCVRKELA